MTDASERFWSKVDKSGGPDVCWPWTAWRQPNGYGQYSLAGRMTGAHRVAWMLTHGEVPPKTDVCHRCDNPPCCNPAHLFLGTRTDNMRDQKRKGRHGRPMAKLTHCPQGHPYDETNTYVTARGWRQCKICKADNQRRRDREKRQRG